MNNKERNITLFLTILCPSFLSLFMAGLPILLPLIRKDLGLSFSQGGGLVALNCLVYGLMQIPAGYLADRFRPKILVFTGTLGITTLSLVLGFVEYYWQIVIIQIMFGFFAAFVLIPAMLIFITWLPPQRRATANVLPTFGIGMGLMLINLIFPVLVALSGSWRTPFIIFSIPGIITAIALFVFGKDSSPRAPLRKFNMMDIPKMFVFPEIWICYALQFIRFSIVQGLVFWLPSLLMGEKFFSLHLAGWMMAIHSITGSTSSILGGYLSDRSGRPTMVIGISMIMLGVTTASLFLIDTIGLISIVIILNAIFLQFYFGPLFAIPIETLGPEKAGVSNGTGNMFANMGGLISAFMMGVIKDVTGSFEYGFYSICGICAIGLLLTVMLSRMRRRRELR